MERLLENPVYSALSTGNHNLSHGSGKAKYFDETVSPFAGFESGYEMGFAELHDLLPNRKFILFASDHELQNTEGWNIQQAIPGFQMIFTGEPVAALLSSDIVLLEGKDIPQMLELTELTRPGPFNIRTIDFGSYYGIFSGEQLVAMTGQRLHPGDYLEISGVCTHPGHLGKGYASKLLLHEIWQMQQLGLRPFLHVRQDNVRAIEVYKRLGFEVSREIIFYGLGRI